MYYDFKRSHGVSDDYIYEKEEKLKDLAKANEATTSAFDSFMKVKLKGAIVSAGGTANPKSEQSPSSASSKQSEEESLNT